MKTKPLILTTLISFLFLTSLPSYVKADSLYPFKNEVLVSNQERTNEAVYFENEGKKEVTVSPRVYSYNPRNLDMSETKGEIFVRADIETYRVKAGEKLEFKYEIIPFSNMAPGTYFNLIVFHKIEDSSVMSLENPVGVIDSLSHLVVLHITDDEASVYGLASNFAQVSISIVENGIPFLKPTRIKYSYQNITNYVLLPMGEIQVFNSKGKYEPTYLKINGNEKKLYPGESIEEEFEIEGYHVSDLIYGRDFTGRFYNGIDQNFISMNTEQPPNYTILILFGVIIVVLVIGIKYLTGKSRKKSAGLSS